MLFKELREIARIPQKEIILDRTVTIRGVDTYLISISRRGNKNVLYAMHHSPGSQDGKGRMQLVERPPTNREWLINNITGKSGLVSPHISELTIQNQKMTFTSSSSRRMEITNFEGYILLKHFMDKGMSFEAWDDVQLSDAILAIYEQEGSEEFPEVDISREPEISLKISRSFQQRLINIPHRLSFGELDKGNKFSFYDSEAGKERTYYLNKVEHYDYWEKANVNFSEELANSMPKEQFSKMKQQHMAAMEQVCPRGMDMAVLEYETEDDIQLNFYSSQYLDDRPEPMSSSGAFGVMFGSKEEHGKNGHKPRLCMLMPVNKDFYGSMEVELFSWYRDIPEETIPVTPRTHA